MGTLHARTEERIVVTPSGVELCFQELGDADAPLVLLVMGMGLSLDFWREDLCRAIAAEGFRVVRFDNRDTGRSTHFTGPVPSGLDVLRRRAAPVYTLADMAGDAAALITALDPRGAHVTGVSLGAFVAQELAIRHPERVRSLVSIMGRPGDGRTGRVARSMLWQFVRPAGRDPVEDMVRAFRRIGSEGRTAEDDEDVRATMRRMLARDRGDGRGGGRQLAAVLAEEDRTPGLRRLTIPVTVLHGERDRVVLPSGGRATAAAVPGAELELVAGMGHDLPRWVWPRVVDAITRTAARS